MPRPFEHTAVFQIEHKFDFGSPEPGEYEVAYPDIEITYKFLPGSPAYTPRGEYGPIDPPDPPEVEFISAKLIHDDGLSLTPALVDEMAREFLDSDAGYREACQAPQYDEWRFA